MNAWLDGEKCVKMIHPDSDLSISVCSFVNFFFIYFEATLAVKGRIFLSSWWNLYPLCQR